MNKKKVELTKRWIEALRSGKYKQGCDQLVRGDRFCCLGVLCDLAKDQFRLKIRDQNISSPEGTLDLSLPNKLSIYLGLRDTPEDEKDTYETILINMNDGYHFLPKRKFKTIANYIEKNILPRLEK